MCEGYVCVSTECTECSAIAKFSPAEMEIRL